MSQYCRCHARVCVRMRAPVVNSPTPQRVSTMKKMIRMAMMAAALFAIVTTTAKAQGGGGGGGRGRGASPTTILKDSLKVSDAIVAKADTIWKAYQAEQAPLMEAARGGDASAREKMTAARTKAVDAIKALLTDEQKAQFDKLMPAGGGRRGGGL